jgi:hypothetical protein
MARSKKRSRTKKSEKPHLITDDLRRKTKRAFEEIEEAQEDLDLKIKKLRNTLDDGEFSG